MCALNAANLQGAVGPVTYQMLLLRIGVGDSGETGSVCVRVGTVVKKSVISPNGALPPPSNLSTPHLQFTSVGT